MNKEINLFYEVRNLFNTSEESFDMYFLIKHNIALNRDFEFGRNILLVFPTREIKDRSMKNAIAKTNLYRFDDNTLKDIIEDTYYYFYSIGEIKRTNFFAGRRFTDIKFLG